jgi:hypothetical protein
VSEKSLITHHSHALNPHGGPFFYRVSLCRVVLWEQNENLPRGADANGESNQDAGLLDQLN